MPTLLHIFVIHYISVPTVFINPFHFRSPERMNSKWSSLFKKSATVSSDSGLMDVFSLGHVIQHCFNAITESIPEDLDQQVNKMIKIDYKRRPTCSQILSSNIFQSENINLMISLNELALKPPLESIEILGRLAGRAGGIPKSVCIHKILPSVGRSLQMAAMDFQNRDARETCRGIVQSAMSLLALLADQNKIEENHFTVRIMPPLLQLWTMSDRSVRSSLLKSLKSLCPLIPVDALNKKIFDPLIAGFGDSNYKYVLFYKQISHV